MKTSILTSIALILIFGILTSQSQAFPDVVVANFSSNAYISKDYEHFSFWVYHNRSREINYRYKDKKGEVRDVELLYLGRINQKGKRGFQVLFPNRLILQIFLSGDVLEVKSETGKYLKYFRWEYEGPVDGRGTFCEPCTKDTYDAIQLLKRFYL